MESLASRIMDAKTKADRAETFEAHEAFFREYQRLRKMWEMVAGNAVIGIEIKTDHMRRAA